MLRELQPPSLKSAPPCSAQYLQQPSMANKLVNKFIPTFSSCRTLSLMKTINIVKAPVCPRNESFPICYLILSKNLKIISLSSMYLRSTVLWENSSLLHRNQNITCALHIVTFNKSSSNAKPENLQFFSLRRCYCTDMSFHFGFLRVFIRSDANCYNKAECSFA